MLERWVFSKSYFDHDGLIVAIDEDSGRIQGYGLAGFAANEAMTELSFSEGVICSVAVRPTERRKGVGHGLVQKCEEYLAKPRSPHPRAGPVWPQCPFGFGLYGGTNCPGSWLRTPMPIRSSAPSGMLPHRRRWSISGSSISRSRSRTHGSGCFVAATRFKCCGRQRSVPGGTTTCGAPSNRSSSAWWISCRITLRARAVVWELEGYSWRWGFPSAGILDIQVRTDLRRQGLAKLLVSQILRFLQDQFFGICELQADANRPEIVALCKSAGLDQVDVGTSYLKPVPEAMQVPLIAATGLTPAIARANLV